MANEHTKTAHSKKKKKNRAARVIIVFAVIFTVLAAGLMALAIWGNKLMHSDTNYPGVYVGKIPVGGLTREQTVETLEACGWEDSLEGVFVLDLPEDVSLRLNLVRAGAVVTNESAADAAYAFGHEGAVFDNVIRYLTSTASPVDVSGDAVPELESEYISMMLEKGARLFAQRTAGEDHYLDERNSALVFTKGKGQLMLDTADVYEKLIAAMMSGASEYTYELPEQNVTAPDFDRLFDEMSAEPSDAYYDRDTDTVVPEVIGVHFDVAKAKKAWKEAALLDDIEIPVTVTVPEVRAEELSQLLFRDKLGGKTTNYWGSTNARINNIGLACEKLNGIILMPGEKLAYNETIGERTAEGGYQAAPAYNGDNVEDQIGGGICQVSSTLYFTTLQADLEINKRTCHNFTVSYLPFGLDATVSWGDPDFVFTNNRDYPIKIVTYTDYNKRSLTIEIWGTNVDGSYVEPVSGWYAMYDEMYTNVQIGWGAVSYRCRYDADGNLIEKVFEAESFYALHKEDIKWPEGVDPDDPHAPITPPEQPDEPDPDIPEETYEPDIPEESRVF